MAKLSGTNRIADSVKDTVDKNLKKIVVDYFEEKLDKQAGLPEKKESTKKAYRKKGWNTEDWFVRTGKSARIIEKRPGVFAPKGAKVLRYVEHSDTFFVVDKQLSDEIKSMIIKELT